MSGLPPNTLYESVRERVQVGVTVHPGTRQNRVALRPDGSLTVWVQARPVEGQANAAVERTVAQALGLRSRQVAVIAGWTSRRKTLAIEGLSVEELQARLPAHE